MNAVHVTLQGKGGIGKSLVACLLAQYHQERNQPRGQSLVCIDADPVNRTLSSYKALAAEAVDEHGVEALCARIAGSERDFVVDIGASVYLPYAAHLVEDGALRHLSATKKITVHVIIVGGAAMQDTLQSLEWLIVALPSPIRFVVWLNDFFAPLQLEGASFEELPLYQQLRTRIDALVHLKHQTTATFATDIADMLARRLTFKEAVSASSLYLMTRQRLVVLQRDLFARLALVPW